MNVSKVLFVTYGGGHANIVKSIYDKLKARPQMEVVILALTVAPKVFKLENIPYITISQVAKKLPYWAQVESIGIGLADTYHKNDSGIDYNDSVAYLGIGYYDLIKKYGAAEAKRLFHKFERKAFLPVETAKEIIKIISPDAVVVTNSPRMEQAAAMAANTLNIPVVRINDLPYMTEEMPYNANLCVMNEWAKADIDRKNLVRDNEVFITGQPVFEEDLKIDNNVKSIYSHSLRNSYNKVVLYLGQTHSVESKIALNELYRIAKEKSDTLFLVRPHPNDFEKYEKFCGRSNFVVSKKGILKYLIASSDVVVTHYSTSGLQAALLGKPLICLDTEGNNPINYAELGIAETIYDIKQLNGLLDVCFNEKSDLYVKLKQGRSAFKNKENAAESICDVILNSIKKARGEKK